MKNMPTVTDNEELTIQVKDYDLIVTHLAHPGLWSRPSKLWLALALDPINHQLRCTNQIVEHEGPFQWLQHRASGLLRFN